MKSTAFQSHISKKLKRSNTCPLCNREFVGSFIDFEIHVDKCLNTTEEAGLEDLIIIEENISTSETILNAEEIFADKQSLESHSSTSENKQPNIKQKSKPNSKTKTKQTQKTNRTENPKYKCPWYKFIPDTNFTMDAFSYGEIENCSIYFLSHFHSDHYGGLNAKFKGKIFCSKVTAELVKLQLRVPDDVITALPMNKRIEVEGHHVTLIDANHCPGAAIFLFETSVGNSIKRILHTGDFRACPDIWNRPDLRDKIDVCYLDTTYCSPSHVFPSQQKILECLTAIITKVNSQQSIQSVVAKNSILKYFKPTQPRKTKCLFVVGTYLIGKEKVIKAVSKAISSKIYVDNRKLAIYKCEDDDYLLKNTTTDPNDADIHVTSMGSLDKENLEAMLKKNKKYTRILAIRPTGWTFSKKQEFSLHTIQIKKISHNIDILPIPYSEHSSFSELKEFVSQLDIAKIVPTVNVAKAKEMISMLSEALPDDKGINAQSSTQNVFNTNLPAACQTPLNQYGPAVITSCFGNSMTTTDISNIQSVLTALPNALNSLCASGCTTAISNFQSNVVTPCGSNGIFAGDTSGQTAAQAISELQIVAGLGCIKAADGSYCIVNQIQQLSSAGLNFTSASIATDLLSFASNSSNAKILCSSCVGSELKALTGITGLDSTTSGVVTSVNSLLQKTCNGTFSDTAGTNTQKSGALQLVAEESKKDTLTNSKRPTLSRDSSVNLDLSEKPKDLAPSFDIICTSNQKFELDCVLDRKNAILIFNFGEWRIEFKNLLKSLYKSLSMFNDDAPEILIISSIDSDTLFDVSKEECAKFKIASDEKNKIAKQYKITISNNIYLSVFVIQKKTKQYLYCNFMDLDTLAQGSGEIIHAIVNSLSTVASPVGVSPSGVSKFKASNLLTKLHTKTSSNVVPEIDSKSSLTSLTGNEQKLKVNIEDKIPLFTTQNLNSVAIDVQKVLQSKNLVLIFYRGSWNSFFSNHLRSIQKALAMFNDKDVEMVAISSEKSENILEQVEDVKLKNKICSDADNHIAKMYGLTINWKPDDMAAMEDLLGQNWEQIYGTGTTLAAPATYVVQKYSGKVVFVDVNTDFAKTAGPKEVIDALVTANKTAIKQQHQSILSPSVDDKQMRDLENVENEQKSTIKALIDNFKQNLSNSSLKSETTEIYKHAEERAAKKIGDSNQFNVGDYAPMFKATTANNQLIDLETIVNLKYVILIFFRGGWCPFSTAHLRSVQKAMEILDNDDVQIIAVSGEKREKLNEMTESQNFKFHIVCDEAYQITKQYGLNYEWKQDEIKALEDLIGLDWQETYGQTCSLSLPASFVIQKKTQKFIFAEVNADYTKWAGPMEIMSAISASRTAQLKAGATQHSKSLSRSSSVDSMTNFTTSETSSSSKSKELKLDIKMIDLEQKNGMISILEGLKKIITKKDHAELLKRVDDRAAQQIQKRTVNVGDIVPNIKLDSADGEFVDVWKLSAKKYVILLFFRGAWCQFSMTHLKSIQKALDMLNESDVEIIAISGETKEKLKILTIEHKFKFKLCSDVDYEVTKMFGLEYLWKPEEIKALEEILGINWQECYGESCSLAVPAAFVVQKKTSKIIFADINPDYSKLAGPKDIIDAIWKSKNVQREDNFAGRISPSISSLKRDDSFSSILNFDVDIQMIESDFRQKVCNLTDQFNKTLTKYPEYNTMIAKMKEFMKNAVQNNRTPSLGDQAAIFLSTSVSDEFVDLEEILQNKYVILMFFFGSWAPFTTLQLKAINKMIEIAGNDDIHVIAVCNENKASLQAMVDESGLTIQVVSDSSNQIINQYGLKYEWSKAEIETINEIYNIDWERYYHNSNIMTIPAVYVIQKKTFRILFSRLFDPAKVPGPKELLDVINSKKAAITPGLSKRNRGASNLSLSKLGLTTKDACKHILKVALLEIDRDHKYLLNAVTEKYRVLVSNDDSKKKSYELTLGATKRIEKSIDTHKSVCVGDFIPTFSFDCNSQKLNSFQKVLNVMEDVDDIEIIGITSEKKDRFEDEIERQRISFKVVNDVDADIAKQFGLFHEYSDEEKRALEDLIGFNWQDKYGSASANSINGSFMVQKKTGRILFAQVNTDFSKLPAPKELLDVLSKAKAKESSISNFIPLRQVTLSGIPALDKKLQTIESDLKLTFKSISLGFSHIVLGSPTDEENLNTIEKTKTKAAQTLAEKRKYKVGEVAPSFKAVTITNENIEIDKLVKSKTLVLVFFRGTWCAFCSNHLKSLHKAFDIFTDNDIEIVAVSGEATQKLKTFANEFKINYTLVHDINFKIAKLYGLDYELKDNETKALEDLVGMNWKQAYGESCTLTTPATFVLQKKTGTLIYASENTDYSHRPGPREIVEAILSSRKRK
ncbi:hypothetical protein HDV06_001411 [Boothiomyces sp. JEL0866]|nr:hypothetical protein HDV06_001411 [Boothiomyces sp. JEL0866]